MPGRIRRAGLDDYEALMRMLESSYGLPVNHFARNDESADNLYMALQNEDGDSPPGCYILEADGKIVSHAGLFPVNLSAGEIDITAGGIGDVATLPEYRGRGHMRRLLAHVIEKMDEGGIALSFLEGDRHRYGNFGWEAAGRKMVLSFTARSLQKAGVAPYDRLDEAPPAEALGEVEKWHENLEYRASRRGLSGKITRGGNRVWLAGDGYVCGRVCEGVLEAGEVFSRSGREAGLIFSAMNMCYAGRAQVCLCPDDTGLKAALIEAASGWIEVAGGLFRINDFCRLLSIFTPLLEKRARSRKISGFDVSLEIDGGENLSVRYSGAAVEISRCKMDAPARLGRGRAARLFLGGAFGFERRVEPLRALLPLPVYVPPLDSV